MKKVFTAIILCIVLAVCNGWMPPRSLKEVKDQSQIFGQTFLAYIGENAEILWEDASESVSDAVTGLLEQAQSVKENSQDLSPWISCRNTAAVHMQKLMEMFLLFLKKRKTDLRMSSTVNWIP